MDTSKETSQLKTIKSILDTEFEHKFPFELEQSLGELAKNAYEKGDEETRKQIIWEIDLLNRTFGHAGQYEGKPVSETSNKWNYYLNSNDLQPLSNLPFCEWDKTAVEYYKRRYEDTSSYLSKARYAFAIMTFSAGIDRLEWAKKSIVSWVKTAERYVNENRYAEFYEIPPFAYDFALKLSLAFGQDDLFNTSIISLHTSIMKILDNGEKRWQLEFFKVEAKYLNKVNTDDSIRKESITRIEKLIANIEDPANKTEKYHSLHFLREYLRLLLTYVSESQRYEINKKIAESYVQEAEGRDELIKLSFYTDAAKKYKEMQSIFSEKREEIRKRIEELTLKINEISPKVNYKKIAVPVEIKKTSVKEFISQLKLQGNGIFEALVSDSSLFPTYEVTKQATLEQKKQGPLMFLFPVVVNREDEPTIRFTTDDKIFDYWLRKNISMGIKIGELMLDETLSELEKENGMKQYEYIATLLDSDDLTDIRPTLKCGFDFIFSEPKNYIAGFHILMPYFEEVIRRIIKKAGKTDVVLQTEDQLYFRKIELGGLLSDKFVAELIGSDFQASLKVLLTDQDQVNLRNELLHGIMKSEKITKEETIFLAYSLLKLIYLLQKTKTS